MRKTLREIFIAFEGDVSRCRFKFACDNDSDLPEQDSIDGRLIDIGSVAHVINTGETYMMNSDGQWKLQKKTDGEGVTFTEEDKAKLDSLTNPMVIKGTVTSRDVLDDIQAKPGWVFFVRPEGASKSEEYVFTEDGEWDPIGDNSIDLSNYVQKTDYATADTGGVVKVNQSRGIKLFENTLAIVTATASDIEAETTINRPMTPSNIPDLMSNYGITKTTIQEIFDRLAALENPK